MKLQTIKEKIHIKCNKVMLCFLVMLSFAVVLLVACSLGAKLDENSSEQGSEIVKYTCISKSNSKKKIYVILKNYHGDYWRKVIEGVSLAAKKVDASVYLGGIENETDISGQISLIEKAMQEGANGILLAPANSDSLMECCKKIRKKKIPLVLVDSSINSSEFDACYMTDNLDAGKLAAKEMLKLLYEAGNLPLHHLEVGISLSADTSQAMVNRVSGFLDYWAEHAPVKWKVNKNILLNGGDLQKAKQDTRTLLKENPSIKGIFACSNTSTVGIADTILKDARTDVSLVGFDMAEETKKVIQNPKYHAVSLLQKQDQMGYFGMLSLNSLVRKEKLEQKYFDTGVVKIDDNYFTENKDK